MNAAKEIQRRIALMNTADSWRDRRIALMNAAKEIQRRIALMNTADSWGDREG